MGKSLDDALKGDLEAIEEQFRQMIGALHRIDTTQPEHRDFVEARTLRALARHVLTARGIDAEGRSPMPTMALYREEIGQGVTAHIQRAVPSPFGPVKVDEQDYALRTMVTLTRVRTPSGMVSDSLYIQPPALAVREWAKGRAVT